MERTLDPVDFDALGGADLVTVNDLTGTDVTSVIVDLEGTPGGAGDGQPDRVLVNGTNGNDTIDVNVDAGGVKVNGLAATVGDPALRGRRARPVEEPRRGIRRFRSGLSASPCSTPCRTTSRTA
jgi:hypothetical protein